MAKPKLELRCEKRMLLDKIDFIVVHNTSSGRSVGKPVEMEHIGDEMVTVPTFSLGMNQAQLIFDQLWQCGLRPNDGTGNSGHVEAIKHHLEDMRSLVFERKNNE